MPTTIKPVNRQKLRELAEEIETIDMKIASRTSEIALLETVKRNREIEFEDALHGDWTEEELMGCVV